MSKPEEPDQVLTVIQSLFEANYALDKRDREIVFHISQYIKNMTGLSDKEKQKLKECGAMDEHDKLLLDPVYNFRGIVLPAFYMKCLMGYHKIIFLNQSETNETK